MSTNTAAYLTAAKAHPFELKSASTWTPGSNEILIQNRAIAINPIDGSLQRFAWLPLQYPTILGQDVAGEVVAVGPDVTAFNTGDRVLGQAMGMATKRPQDAGFQTQTILDERMASRIPDDLSFEKAVVVPLGLSTAACGLFQEAPFLGLKLPTEPARKPTGETVLIWGGASSVGSNGIQLAKAAGYEVIATASTKNFEYVKQLGASQVFDYKSESVVDDLVKAFEGKTFVGVLDCIGFEAANLSVKVVKRVAGKGAVASTKGGVEDLPEGITLSKIFGITLRDNGVGKAVYADYLPQALESGTFVPSPEPLVQGKGLEHVQAGVDRLMAGVSAAKVVVTL
jgi:NADPH:quinone reductase-like Zn-dependent oxidoreductase